MTPAELYEVRDSFGYTQMEMAQKLGISLRTYQRLENVRETETVPLCIELAIRYLSSRAQSA